MANSKETKCHVCDFAGSSPFALAVHRRRTGHYKRAPVVPSTQGVKGRHTTASDRLDGMRQRVAFELEQLRLERQQHLAEVERIDKLIQQWEPMLASTPKDTNEA